MDSINYYYDCLWYYLGYVNKCWACSYKNVVCYKCLNCDKKFCIDCYKDNVLITKCKWCPVP